MIKESRQYIKGVEAAHENKYQLVRIPVEERVSIGSYTVLDTDTGILMAFHNQESALLSTSVM